MARAAAGLVMHIRVLWLGKTKSLPIRTLAVDYLERTRHMVPCEVVEVRDPGKGRSLRADELVAAEAAQLSKSLGSGARIVALDAGGMEFTSEELARWLCTEQNHGTREIDFIIGGPEGLSRDIMDKAHLILSMGRMTWTHEMCRALLMEQLYRSYCILRNVPYHK